MPLPPEAVPYCRTCRRALHTHTSLGGVAYTHAVESRGATVDHRPDPAPITEIPDPLIECDFCSAPQAAWIYRCGDQRTNVRTVTARIVSATDYRNRHHAARTLRVETGHALTQAWGARWAACTGCAQLIEARDLYGLIRRVVDAMPAKLVRGNRLARVRGHLHDTYTEVFATLTPGRGQITPGHPLGLWPTPTDGAP